LRLDFVVESHGVDVNVDTAQNIIHFTVSTTESAMPYRDPNVFDANHQSLTERIVQVDADRFAPMLPRPPRKGRCARAFTLIELLVVIAVIGNFGGSPPSGSGARKESGSDGILPQ